MLIGIDASRAAYSQRTGTENYSLFLIRHMLQLDKANQYRLYFSQAPAADLFSPAPNVQIRHIPFPRLWTHLRLSFEMLAVAPDVLFVPAHVLPILHPLRSVVTVHDLGYLHFPEAHTAWDRWYLQWSTEHNARSAAHIIADSEATKRDLVQHCHVPESKISVVYPGYDPSIAPVSDLAVLDAVRKRYGLPSGYLIYVGTLQPRKNLIRLLDAMAILARDHDAHLAIAGKKGWLYEGLFAHVRKLGLENRITFTGYVPQGDLPALISGANAFVLPSLYEGFGLPVLEAMACGTPVICSNTSSLPEVVGDAAVLIDPSDISQLAQAIASVLESPHLRQELRGRGLERVKRFSWADSAAAILRVLDSAPWEA